jgi:MscS family membrane protein
MSPPALRPDLSRGARLCALAIAGAMGLTGFGVAGAAEAEAATNAVAAASQLPLVPAQSKAAWLTFGLDKVPWLQSEVLGNPAWQYLASLIYIVLAFYVSKGLDYFIQVRLRKWAAKTATQIDDLLLDLLRGPVKLIAFVIFLHIGLRVFAWPDWAASFISNGLKIVVACSLTYVVLKVVDLLLGVWQKRVETAQEGVLDMQLFPVIRKTLKVFVIIVAVLVTSQNLGMNVTGLLASVSIGGLAVGLAAQDTLSNLFGAVAIFADKPFRVGDRIQLDAIDGTVETIGLRSTRVRNLDGHLVTIPNRTIANASIVNVSKRPNIKTVMNIGVTYDTPAQKVQRAMQIIDEVFRPHPKTVDLIVSFNKFESSSLNILVVHWWNSTNFKEYLGGFKELNLELKRRFDEEKISFAFPTQTVYLKQDSEWRLVSPAATPPSSGA